MKIFSCGTSHAWPESPQTGAGTATEHRREPRAQAALLGPNDVREGIKAAWAPPGEICSHPDINNLFLEIFGSLTQLHQQISLSLTWFVIDFLEGVFEAAILVIFGVEIQGKEKALLIKRDSSVSHSSKLNSGDFSYRKSAVLGENANNFRQIICFTRNLNYFKFQHLTVSRSANRYLILNLAYLWQLSYICWHIRDWTVELLKQKNEAGIGWANNPQIELQAGSFQVSHKAKYVLSCSHQTWHGDIYSGGKLWASNLKGKFQCTHTRGASRGVTNRGGRCINCGSGLNSLLFLIWLQKNVKHGVIKISRVTKSSWLQQKLPLDERQKRHEKIILYHIKR